MSRYRDNTETLSGLVVRTSEKAVLFRNEHAEVWVPRSVCIDGDMVDQGDTDLVVQSWFAEKEGLL